MNPLFRALTGGSGPVQSMAGQMGQPMMNGPLGALQGVMQRANQLAQSFGNPQAMVSQMFPNAPAEVRNDPEQLAAWMQQSGMVSPQIVQMARQMMGGR